MFEVIIDLFELVGQKAELTYRDRVLHAMAHQVAIGGVEKEAGKPTLAVFSKKAN
jgi:hypothetical protein